MKILPLFVLVACMVCAHAQDEAEGRPAPARGLLKRGPLNKAKPTTTTTTLAPQEEPEYEDEEEYAEVATEAPVSSTEGKKLVAGGVRPFRSNTDLLEALKRRRAQAAEAKHNGSAAAASSASSTVSQDAAAVAEAKSNYSKKRGSNPTAREVNNEEAPKPVTGNRGRFGRTSSRSIPESELEEQIDSAPAIRNSRFSRRGGN